LQHEKVACGSDDEVTANGKEQPDTESLHGRDRIDAAGLTSM
jgi:hypothetical protein